MSGIPSPLDAQTVYAIEQAAEKAAEAALDKAAARWGLMLGVDISTPEGILEIQRDTYFLRKFRNTAQSSTGKAVAGIMSLVFSGIGAGAVMIWEGLSGPK